jgi:hypothetical protein
MAPPFARILVARTPWGRFERPVIALHLKLRCIVCRSGHMSKGERVMGRAPIISIASGYRSLRRTSTDTAHKILANPIATFHFMRTTESDGSEGHSILRACHPERLNEETFDTASFQRRVSFRCARCFASVFRQRGSRRRLAQHDFSRELNDPDGSAAGLTALGGYANVKSARLHDNEPH